MTKTKSKILSLVMCLALIVLSITMLAGCDNSISFGRYENAEEYEATSNYEYAAAEIDTIDIDWCVGDISLTRSIKSTLSVKEFSEGLEENQLMHVYKNGSTLYIKFWESNLKSKLDRKEGIKNLYLEYKTGITLRIKNTSGDITSRDLEVKTFDFSTVSGEVEIDNLTIIDDGEVKIKTISGDVEISDMMTIGSVNLTVDTVSGDVRVSANCNSLIVDTTSGDVGIIAKCKSVNIHTVSGDVRVGYLVAIGLNVTYDTTSGNYHADGNKKTFEGALCNLEVNTTSGDLTIFAHDGPLA